MRRYCTDRGMCQPGCLCRLLMMKWSASTGFVLALLLIAVIKNTGTNTVAPATTASKPFKSTSPIPQKPTSSKLNMRKTTPSVSKEPSIASSTGKPIAAPRCVSTTLAALASGMATVSPTAMPEPLGASVTSTKPLRFGALGASRITENALILPSLEPLVQPHVQVTMVASRTVEHAVTLIQKHGLQGAASTSDYLEVVQSKDVDAVYIALPNGLHYEWASAALRAGKHVLCEKALAANAEEARQLILLARTRGLLLMEGLAFFHHPLFEQMRAVLASGEL
eukprot:7387047-Prymnesium_polylepis.1